MAENILTKILGEEELFTGNLDYIERVCIGLGTQGIISRTNLTMTSSRGCQEIVKFYGSVPEELKGHNLTCILCNYFYQFKGEIEKERIQILRDHNTGKEYYGYPINSKMA